MSHIDESSPGKIADLLRSALQHLGKGTALAYSGGLDSSVIMAASGFSLIPCTVGLTGSRDMQNAVRASEILNFPLNTVTIGEKEIVQYRELLLELDPNITRAELGYEIVLAAVLDNVDEGQVATGQGADELFYGYRRFIDDPHLSNEAHMEKLFNITLPRERKLSGHFNKTLVTPFLDKDIMGIAQSMGRDEHISGGVNKKVLREVASILGLPPEISGIPKKAAQYGSGVNRVLSRIIKK